MCGSTSTGACRRAALCRRARSHRPRILPFVLALLIRTGNHGTSLKELLNEIRTPAIRALLGKWLMCGSELAFRIISAPIKRVSLARPLLDNFAILAQRTLHPNEVLLDVLALRIAAARRELTIAPMPQD